MGKIEAIRRRVRCMTGRHVFTRWIPAVVLYKAVELRSCHWCGRLEARWGTEQPAEPQEKVGDRLACRAYRGQYE